MVQYWLPEPSRGADEAFHLEGVQVLADSDESDDDGFDHMGYELLPAEPTPGLANENGDFVGNDSDNGSSGSETPHLEEDAPPYFETIHQASEAVETSCSSRSDIEVDCDEVRAAMRNITLPPSSFPSWASEIPEAHWTPFLMARINNIQSHSGMK